ncbi:MAG TPA: hypothetical protein P5186_13100 [Candidatus Paceibacterota bacterium]|nr:hypothetical protein [Verrucomicrobiota bacterium]HRY48978.1 hypothetical protein [Candidatus Paceibacterota bacterium]HSA01489.1 hypothetical protein [Candidatus Paceibacterota bacterium]
MLAPVSVYASAETVLGDPFLAPQVRDAIIIHDPLKVLDRVQRTVVKEFYALEWLNQRVDSVLGSIESRFSGLCRAIVSDDKIGIIGQAGLLMRGLVEMPLTRLGVSPSCTRSLMQLGDLRPSLVSRMEVIEGAGKGSRSSIDLLLGILTEAAQLMDPERRGGFADYFLDTLRRMIDAGHDREAVHAGWVALGVQTAGFYRVADDEMKSHAALLAERWLRSVHGWGTSETATKTKLIRGLLEKIRRTIRSGPRPNH